MEFIKKTAAQQNVEQVYGLSDYSLYQLTNLIEKRLDESSVEVTKILIQKDQIEKRIGEYDSYLNLDINSQELSDINDEIRKVEAEIIKSQMLMDDVSSKIAQVETNLRENTMEFNKVLEAYLSNAEYQDGMARTSKYSEMIINVLDKYMVELQKRKADLLGKTITECYKKLASKRSLIDSITMDPETLDYTFYSDTNDLVPKDSLSAGEKQVMIIAILWALAICAKQKLPVIIDTPLSRLDSNHRKTIIKKYFPHASQQTIILSTDSEIDVNNETGIIQPVDEIGRSLLDRDVLFHVDATQSCGKLVEEIQNLKYDMLSFSSHKMGGPQGVGVLVLKRSHGKRLPVKAITYGGQQENGIRPGTVPVALVAGCGEACRLSSKNYKLNNDSARLIKKAILNELNESGLEYQILGDSDYCIDSTLNVSLVGISSESLMLATKAYCGISNGSACTSKSYTASYVLKAMGLPDDVVNSAIRISWGHQSDIAEIKMNFHKLLESAYSMVN